MVSFGNVEFSAVNSPLMANWRTEFSETGHIVSAKLSAT
ncbi:hypothetical protein SZ54_3960 [Rhizobium sp. UR51a]|nr:hypothetical protein SZ54_3960 [Rhizobium sp. UR51a]